MPRPQEATEEGSKPWTALRAVSLPTALEGEQGVAWGETEQQLAWSCFLEQQTVDRVADTLTRHTTDRRVQGQGFTLESSGSGPRKSPA